MLMSELAIPGSWSEGRSKKQAGETKAGK